MHLEDLENLKVNKTLIELKNVRTPSPENYLEDNFTRLNPTSPCLPTNDIEEVGSSSLVETIMDAIPSTSRMVSPGLLIHQNQDDQDDQDDEIRDPNYEAIESESLSEGEIFPKNRRHIVADDCESIEGNEETDEGKGRPQRGRKRKYESQNRTDRKIRKNSNQSYYNSKGKKLNQRNLRIITANVL